METHWPEEPDTWETKEQVMIWRVTSRPLLQIKTLTGFYKSASSCQFVCIEHRMSM